MKVKFEQTQEKLAYVVSELERKIDLLLNERDEIKRNLEKAVNENNKIRSECEKAFKDINNCLELIEELRNKYVSSNA